MCIRKTCFEASVEDKDQKDQGKVEVPPFAIPSEQAKNLVPVEDLL
jgi:hypothetical protein